MLNEDNFVVIRGKKRVRKLVLPYSLIENIGNRVVTLRLIKSEVLEGPALQSRDSESVSKRRFIAEIGGKLTISNSNRAERITRIVLYLLSKRLSADEKKRLKKNLPAGIRNLWATVEQSGSGQFFNMSDFLLPIKKQGRFQTMEEAFLASREVFGALKGIMPTFEAMELSRTLPRGLQEIWESAS
jgi:uncharacterized protein (DUF2267 family)